MRRTIVAFSTIAAAAALVGASQLPLNTPQPPSKPMSDPSFPQAGLGFDLTPSVGGGNGQGVTLADALTVDRKGGLWWDYARDLSAVTARLSARGTLSTTILVPVDSAIRRLGRKPHLNKGDEENTDKTNRKNISQFVSAHIVPGLVDLPSNEAVDTLLDGLKVKIVRNEAQDGWIVQPGDIPVLQVKEVTNGQILYIDGVIPF